MELATNPGAIMEDRWNCKQYSVQEARFNKLSENFKHIYINSICVIITLPTIMRKSMTILNMESTSYIKLLALGDEEVILQMCFTFLYLFYSF